MNLWIILLEMAVFAALFTAIVLTAYRGDYCDFCLKPGAPVMKAWPPVFAQGKGYK